MIADRRAVRCSRRRFVQGTGLAGLGLLAGCGRLPGLAEQPPKTYRVGLLSSGSAQVLQLNRDAFLRGLRDYGYVEGQNLILESRYAEGQPEQADDFAAELSRLPVDVIAAGGTRAILAAKNATSTIPIVIGFSSDPWADGLVTSLAHPGANLTGLSSISPRLSGKRLELLKEAVPGTSRMAVLWDVSIEPLTPRWQEIQAAAQVLGLDVISMGVRSPGELERAFDAATREHAEVLIVVHNALTSIERQRIVALAARSRLPTMYDFREWVSVGGLMAYGPRIEQMWNRAAYYVDRILKGAKPADLPVEQPREFEFVINLRTAQALGLTIPQHVLLQATEIIQ
ncbi:MAG TPA: ABC transporter substrate-binding protein [Chloroflexota bacterium]|jgi:putative ABC transport system substrate-binding protein